MQKNVVIPENRFVEDLGTGWSYVNFDRDAKQVTDDTGTKTIIVAGEQYRVRNPATKERIINLVISENYTDGRNEAALRKGILNVNDPDFVDFNAFAESVKKRCADEGF